MKLVAIRIKNFRGYKNSGWIRIGDLTGFVGKNDSGKSTILEALNLFFDNNRRLEVKDLRRGLQPSSKVEIACAFSDLPAKVVLDDAIETTLRDEYLLNETNELVLSKKYLKDQCGEVFVFAKHPVNAGCSDLLMSKDTQLRATIDKKSIPCVNKSSNVEMRKAIRKFYSQSLKFEEKEIQLRPEMADRLLKYLPRYFLFKADRENTEDDILVRKPINDEILELINNHGLDEHFESVAKNIRSTLDNLLVRTLEKMTEIGIPLTASLKPLCPEIPKSRWANVFRDISLVGDDDIPIEKRGSGIRRLVLLSFLRATKELDVGESSGLIYAIEEPETAQHCDNQKKLICSLRKISAMDGFQVIVTTHSATIAKEIGLDSIRIVEKTDNSVKTKSPDSFFDNGRLAQSLNFIAFRVFGECMLEYHNELYGYIEAHGLMKKCGNEYVAKNGARMWKRIKDGKEIEELKSICYYVRNSIHHPENTKNPSPTDYEIMSSIKFMESFIKRNKKEFTPDSCTDMSED